MIYGISSWEKPDKLQPWLRVNDNTVVFQQTKFATSQEYIALAIVIAIISTGAFLFPYLTGELSFFSFSFRSVDALSLVGIGFSFWLFTRSKEGVHLRQEQGGIHPSDTLFVLDGSKRVLMKQQGSTENLVTSFENLKLELQTQRSGKRVTYRICAIHPKGKEQLISTSTQKSGQTLVDNIKTRINLT